MKLSISNIAWTKEQDEEMYVFLKDIMDGIEIAPTRIFEENPYEKLDAAKNWSQVIKEKYGLEVSSMQSILYGKTGKIFENINDRIEITNYLKKAIDFASQINCKNIVFGCPQNRIINENTKEEEIISFFKELGEYAVLKETVIAIEPNPVIYKTNLFNYTKDAIEFVKKANCNGLLVNVDLGTIIENNEDIDVVINNLEYINHIHISEPNLESIKNRNLHKRMIDELKKHNYKKYLSIEMKRQDDIKIVKEIIEYIKKGI